MSKKFKILLVLISLSITMCVMSNTYSRYIADATSNIEVLFAKWQILVNENDITDNNSSEITLVPVIEENANVAANKVAPSSKGYFDIIINPSNVQVSFDYSIDLSVVNTDMPDLMITRYSIIDSTYVEGDELTINNLTNNKITGTLNFDNATTNFQFEPFTIRIYFEWYDGTGETMNDTDDTTVGKKAAVENTSLKMNAKITFEQKLK